MISYVITWKFSFSDEKQFEKINCHHKISFCDQGWMFITTFIEQYDYLNCNKLRHLFVIRSCNNSIIVTKIICHNNFIYSFFMGIFHAKKIW